MHAMAYGLDPRLILDTIDAFGFTLAPLAREDKARKTPEHNGTLTISRVGLHFTDATSVVHLPFLDVFPRAPQRTFIGGLRMRPFVSLYSYPLSGRLYNRSMGDLGGRRLLPLGYHGFALYVGYHYIPGEGMISLPTIWQDSRRLLTNANRRRESRVLRNAFIEYLTDVARYAPTLAFYTNVSPYRAYAEYFADACAVGPALHFIDAAFDAWQIQQSLPAQSRKIARSQKYRKLGYQPHVYFPFLTHDDVVALARRRAWLYLDQCNYQALLASHVASPQISDGELEAARGFAHAMLNQRSAAWAAFNQAYLLEPVSPIGLAAGACAAAFSQQASDSQQLCEQALRGAPGYYTWLFCAYASELTGNQQQAAQYYLHAAEHARGFYQGYEVFSRLTNAVKKGDAAVQMAQQIAATLRINMKAWEDAERFASRANDHAARAIAITARQACDEQIGTYAPKRHS